VALKLLGAARRPVFAEIFNQIKAPYPVEEPAFENKNVYIVARGGYLV
jgi:hypothetical protein